MSTLNVVKRWPPHAAPAKAGQAIGDGLQIDISKYYNQVLEINEKELWVRAEPGIVLDELNAQLALSKIPNAQVVDLDAGCCGMAGSFGYTHYDVSVSIANRKLLSALRNLKQGQILVATGTSCRQQIKDLAEATAIHPAVLVRNLWPNNTRPNTKLKQ